MIPVALGDEPDDFHDRVRQPGLKWLKVAGNRTKSRPEDYWLRCAEALKERFGCRCGFLGQRIITGHVDHFISIARDPERLHVYEWTNYRWLEPTVNQSKSARGDYLDPCVLQPGWLEMRLPSLDIEATPALPPAYREAAERTVAILNRPPFKRRRLDWLRHHLDHGVSLEVLDQEIPLLAEAIRRTGLKPAPA